MVENNEIIAIDDIENNGIREYNVADLHGSHLAAFCSITDETFDGKMAVYNAANNPDAKVNDIINKRIEIRDVYAETIELVNEDTGELEKAPRIVLIDKDGKSYQCVSAGVFGALKKLNAIFGEPTWVPPIPVEVKQLPTKNGSMLTLQVVK